jgi:hypothetical protein
VEEINKESMSIGLKPAAMDPSLPATSVPLLPFTRRHHANLLHSVLLNQVPPVEEACLVHPSPARQQNKKASPPLMPQETITQNRESIFAQLRSYSLDARKEKLLKQLLVMTTSPSTT